MRRYSTPHFSLRCKEAQGYPAYHRSLLMPGSQRTTYVLLNTVSFATSGTSASLKGVCLERIDNGSYSYLNMVPHQDGSNRVFLGTDLSWEHMVGDRPGAGAWMHTAVRRGGPVLDLTDPVHFDSAFGLMGMAFHPDFATNGRFFTS